MVADTHPQPADRLLMERLVTALDAEWGLPPNTVLLPASSDAVVYWQRVCI